MSEETESNYRTVAECIGLLHETAPGSIGDLMRFRAVEENPEKGEYTLRCSTQSWMRNVHGTLHGGMCATIMDQAMGFIAHSRMAGKGTTPTIQMQVNYHRPLIPGEDVIVRIRVVSETRNLVSMFSEAALASSPDRVCLTASATSFLKRAAE